METEEILELEDVTLDHIFTVDSLNPRVESMLRVNLDRVRSNILNCFLKSAHRREHDRSSDGSEIAKRFKEVLALESTSRVFSCSILLTIIEINFTERGVEHPKLSSIKKALLKTLSKNRMETEAQADKRISYIIKKVFFDVVAQAVFYSFYYAFPKCRKDFDIRFRIKIFQIVSRIFTGVSISHHARFLKGWNFVEDWHLDMGRGNVLSLEDLNIKKSRLVSKMVKTTKSLIQFSPLIESYFEGKQLKYKNMVKPIPFRYTPFNEDFTGFDMISNSLAKEFDDLKASVAKKANSTVSSAQKLDKEVAKIKNQALEQIRNLHKRRNQELERGAHEYANYLIAMRQPLKAAY